MPLDKDPISSASEGAVKGALSWTTEQIKEFAQKFRRRDVAFINDKVTISLVLEQRKSVENKQYKEYLKDKNHRLLAQMGMTLRRLENDQDKIKNLRDKIRTKHGTKGLHIAQVVQTGLLNALIATLLTNIQSTADIHFIIESILNDVDKFVEFINANDAIPKKVKILKTRLDASAFPILLVCGMKTAKEKALKIGVKLDKELDEYELIKIDEKRKAILLFLKESFIDEALGKKTNDYSA